MATLLLSRVIRTDQKLLCSQNNKEIKISTDRRYSVTCVCEGSVSVSQVQQRQLSGNTMLFVSPAPINYANAEPSVHPQGAVASPCHTVPTLTRV